MPVMCACARARARACVSGNRMYRGCKIASECLLTNSTTRRRTRRSFKEDAARKRARRSMRAVYIIIELSINVKLLRFTLPWKIAQLSFAWRVTLPTYSLTHTHTHIYTLCTSTRRETVSKWNGRDERLPRAEVDKNPFHEVEFATLSD